MSEMSKTYQPEADVEGLDRLVGTWAITGGAAGTVRYEGWPRRLLPAPAPLAEFGQPVTGLEVIGNLRRPFGEPAARHGVALLRLEQEHPRLRYELTGDKDHLGRREGQPRLLHEGTFSAGRHHRHRRLGLSRRRRLRVHHDPDLTSAHVDDLTPGTSRERLARRFLRCRSTEIEPPTGDQVERKVSSTPTRCLFPRMPRPLLFEGSGGDLTMVEPWWGSGGRTAPMILGSCRRWQARRRVPSRCV